MYDEPLQKQRILDSTTKHSKLKVHISNLKLKNAATIKNQISTFGGQGWNRELKLTCWTAIARALTSHGWCFFFFLVKHMFFGFLWPSSERTMSARIWFILPFKTNPARQNNETPNTILYESRTHRTSLHSLSWNRDFFVDASSYL